ncbi:MAG TPA: CRISPR-associated endonuclease Cas2, partial [Elusimicrobiales bacterium]|nr:CRISPR-associated endonuclease Cas2 [Elusimicrobiales bacterium]
MAATDDRFMRLLVFFDLPVQTKEERRHATQFRKFLLNDGYFMLQWSVYCRICRGEDNAQTHLNRLKGAVPAKGSIRSLQITDQQYGRMQLLLGTTIK